MVVLHRRLAGLLAVSNNLEGWEALNAHLPAEGFVHLFIAVDGGDFGDAGEGFGGRLVRGLKVLAVAAPWRVESERCEERG